MEDFARLFGGLLAFVYHCFDRIFQLVSIIKIFLAVSDFSPAVHQFRTNFVEPLNIRVGTTLL
jgi:hypothetical protein